MCTQYSSQWIKFSSEGKSYGWSSAIETKVGGILHFKEYYRLFYLQRDSAINYLYPECYAITSADC